MAIYARRTYDWRACGLAVLAASAAALPVGLLIARLTGSTMLMTVVISLIGTAVSKPVYRRVARRGARPIDDESCPR